MTPALRTLLSYLKAKGQDRAVELMSRHPDVVEPYAARILARLKVKARPPVPTSTLRKLKSGCRSGCPTVTDLFDAEGRRYQVTYKAVPADEIVTSNKPRTFMVNPDYPVEFQARDLSSYGESRKISHIAKNLDPTRVLIPHGDSTLGAPVVWHHDGRYYVLGGNGRTIALLMAPPDKFAEYQRAARRDWPDVYPARDNGQRAIVVRVVRWANGKALSLHEAIQLAGASQESTAAAETPIGRAMSVARSLGIFDLAQLPPFDWRTSVTTGNVDEFKGKNPAFWNFLMSRMDPARQEAFINQHKAAELINQVLVLWLPKSVRAGAFDDEASEEMLLAALPIMVTIEQAINKREIEPKWSLLRVLPDAVAMYRLYRRKRWSIHDAHNMLEAASYQTVLEGADDTFSNMHLLGFLLGMVLYRSGRQKDPSEGVEKILGRYANKALNASVSAIEMFGGTQYTDTASGSLADALGIKLPTRVPEGMIVNPRRRRK